MAPNPEPVAPPGIIELLESFSDFFVGMVAVGTAALVICGLIAWLLSRNGPPARGTTQLLITVGCAGVGIALIGIVALVGLSQSTS